MYPPVRFKFLIVQILKQYFQIQGNFESNLIITLLDSFSRFDSEDRKPKNNLCFHYQFTNFKLQIHSETKQNHIDNHFLQFDFLLKTCKPSMWDPDWRKLQCTHGYISGFNLRDFRWNEKLRKMRYVPDIGEPKQPIPQKKVEMISEEANLIG